MHSEAEIPVSISIMLNEANKRKTGDRNVRVQLFMLAAESSPSILEMWNTASFLTCFYLDKRDFYPVNFITILY